MTIEIKKDHPLTMVGFIALGFILSKMPDSMDGSAALDDPVLLVLLLFLVAAYLIQIRQTVILEEGKLIFIEKKKRVELIIPRIVSVSRKGRKLTILHHAGELEIDVGCFSKRHLQALLSHLANYKNQK